MVSVLKKSKMSSPTVSLCFAIVAVVAVVVASIGTGVTAQITRQECTDVNAGTIVGDIGNGAIFQPDYVCEGSGLPPIDLVVASDGEPIASEGEVCCPPSSTTTTTTDRPEITREECTGDDVNGIIVGDIGDGATRRDDYICQSNGQPPVANIVPAEGQPIAIEGEVCCGQEQQTETLDTATTTTTTMTTTAAPTAGPTAAPPTGEPSSSNSHFHGWTITVATITGASFLSVAAFVAV